MVLFSISCETCTSRLNVKQQGAIGQVLACPKCGSMVQVQPPEGWVNPEPQAPPPRKPRPPRDPADSQATLSTQFDDLGNPAAPRKPMPTAPRTVRTAPVNRDSSKNGNVDANGVAVSGTSSGQIGKAPRPSSPPVQDSPIMPDGNWISPAAKQRGKAVAWIAGILGLCLLALVLILYMITRMVGGGDDETDPTRLAGANSSAINEPAENDNTPVIDEHVQPDDTGNGNARDNAAEEKNDPQIPAQPEDPNPKMPVDTPVDTTVPDDNDVNPETTTSPDENPVTDGDPTGIDPDAALTTSGSIGLEPGKEEKSLLDEFEGDLFDPGVSIDKFRDATTDDQSSPIGIGNIYVPRPDPLNVDFEKATAEKYLDLSFPEMALIDFLRNVNRLTRIPVQLDDQAIVSGQIDPLAQVSGQVENGTALDLLRSAIEPLNLKWRWNDDHDTIIVFPSDNDLLVPVEFADASSLVADEKQASELIRTIQLVIEPASWNTNGGTGTLRYADGKFIIEQTGYVRLQTEDLLRRLVIAAKLKENPKDEELLARLATVYSRNSDLWNDSSAFESIQLSPVFQILNSVHKIDGVTIMIDWSELMEPPATETTIARTGWNPDLRISWNSSDLTFEKTLRNLTSSMGLGYRLLDENILEITSRRRLQNATRLEVYPCGIHLKKKHTAVEILRILQNGIGADLPDQVHTRVEYIAELECIVAVLPDPLHIRIEKILDQMAESE